MRLAMAVDVNRLIGYEMDRLTFEERLALTGKWVAFEIYTPKTLPIRRIEAVGDSPAECARRLAARGLEVAKFEFSRVTPPY